MQYISFFTCLKHKACELLVAGIIINALTPGMVHGSDRGSTDWAPDTKLIAQLEARIKLPPGAATLSRYTRYYAGTIEHGRRLVVGTYHGNTAPGASGHVVIMDSATGLPMVLDGGCGIITLKYDVANHRFLAVFCNGVA